MVLSQFPSGLAEFSGREEALARHARGRMDGRELELRLWARIPVHPFCDLDPPLLATSTPPRKIGIFRGKHSKASGVFTKVEVRFVS